VGENLARQELYLLLSALLKKYKISPANSKSIDFGKHIEEGLVTTMKPVELIFSSAN